MTQPVRYPGSASFLERWIRLMSQASTLPRDQTGKQFTDLGVLCSNHAQVGWRPRGGWVGRISGLL